MIEKANFQPAAHPCGNCVEYSIYGVCWRGGGCGVEPCAVTLNPMDDEPGYCGGMQFIFTATRIAGIKYGPHAAPADGTLTTEFIVDHAVVKEPTSQDVLESVEYVDLFTPEDDLFFASGWHSIKIVSTWKDASGVVISQDDRTLCVYAAIRPTGDDELELWDVIILPGSGAEVCIDQNLKAARMLGPYRSHADVDFVLEYWNEIIMTWAQKCLCPNTCVGSEKMGGWNDDGPFQPGHTDATGAAIGYANQDWLGCLPMDIPLYVDLSYIVNEAPQSGLTVYLKFYDSDDEEIDEIEIGFEYNGRFVVPPCQYVKVIVANDTGDVWPPPFSGLTLPFNFISSYANRPLPTPAHDIDTESECPYENDLSDMVPSNAEYLRDWLAEIPPEE